MSQKAKLQQKLTAAEDKMKAILKAAQTEGRARSEQETTDFNAAQAERDSLRTQIADAEALEELERNAPAAATPGTPTVATVGHDNAQDKPWASFGEFLGAVRKQAKTHGREFDPRLKASLGSNETVDSEGGFLVQPDIAAGILQRTYETGQIINRCRHIPMASSRLVMNGLVEDSRATGQRYGGLQVYRIGEGQEYIPSKPKFRRLELNANKLIGLLYATEELLADQNALTAWANQTFPEAFAFEMDDEVLNGTGAGEFLGVLNSGACIVQAIDAGQQLASQPVTTNNLLQMDAHLWGPSRANAAWFVNASVLPALYSITLGSGTAVELLYTPPGYKGNGNEYGMLLGHPVIPVEQASALGTVGDIILADMQQYIIGDRQGIRADSSIHVAFLTGEEAFRWMLRNDGQPMQSKPLAPYKGTESLSSFVTLAART